MVVFQLGDPIDLIQIHIPKTGGSIIKQTLNKKYKNINSDIDFSGGFWQDKNKKRPYTCGRIHRPPRRPIPNSFTVVRNPYVRLVSEYLYGKNGGSSHGRWFNETNQEDQWGVDDYNKCTCNDFRNYTMYKLNKYRINININDCHYIPQWNFAKNVKYIVHFENLTNELYSLWKKFHIKVRLPVYKNKNKIECEQFIFNSSCIQENKKCIDTINTLYRSDFKNLGYSMRQFFD